MKQQNKLVCAKCGQEYYVSERQMPLGKRYICYKCAAKDRNFKVIATALVYFLVILLTANVYCLCDKLATIQRGVNTAGVGGEVLVFLLPVFVALIHKQILDIKKA